MEPICIQDFKRIIREANYDNTYKMAWGKALVDLSFRYADSSDNQITVSLKDMAECILGYYWNQTIFFDLVQGSNLSKPPVILQIVKEMIAHYQSLFGHQPVFYVKACAYFQDKEPGYYQKTVDKAATILKHDVSYRFLSLSNTTVTSLYSYSKGDSSFVMSTSVFSAVKENAQDLYDLINYRWSLILETFNTSPRINKKVRICRDEDIRRSPLKRFDKFLDLENKEHICFICGKPIAHEELSIDHVIPWSYLYSDDLWNLVYVHKNCNSSKNDHVPSEASIKRLEERNDRLKLAMEEAKQNGKEYKELKLAIEHDYVEKFYSDCKR